MRVLKQEKKIYIYMYLCIYTHIHKCIKGKENQSKTNTSGYFDYLIRVKMN